MTSPRTLLGPLTTTWTQPAVCSYAMGVCATCSTGYVGQTCNAASDAHDWTDCWPPRASALRLPDPGVMMGWGFYSPGLACPAGYTTAAMATSGGATGWGLEYELTKGETAAACCPSGFHPSSIETLKTYAATCVAIATSSSFSTVLCDSGTFTDFSMVTVPDSRFNSFTVLAPLFQLNFRSADVLAATTATTTTKSSPTTSTSDPVASLKSATATATRTTNTISSSSGASSDGGSSSPGGALSTGAKVGIGVGAGVAGLLLLAAIIYAMFRVQRKKKRAREAQASGNTPDEQVAPPRKTLSKRRPGIPAQELAGVQVSELQGRQRPGELPATSTSIGSPRQPAALFELEADVPPSLRVPFSGGGGGGGAPPTPMLHDEGGLLPSYFTTTSSPLSAVSPGSATARQTGS